jgi:hypothetical protein
VVHAAHHRQRRGVRCGVDRVAGLVGSGRALPLILYNRGGMGELGTVRPNTQFGFWTFVQAGYAVIATQYRGDGGSEGREDSGGGDVCDMMHLLPRAARGIGVVVTPTEQSASAPGRPRSGGYRRVLRRKPSGNAPPAPADSRALAAKGLHDAAEVVPSGNGARATSWHGEDGSGYWR